MKVAPDVAWVMSDDAAYLARLPSGPIAVLEGPAALIWEELSAPADGRPLADRVRDRLADPPGDLAAHVQDFVSRLVAQGWIAASADARAS